MCGIAGYIGAKDGSDGEFAEQAVLSQLAHRGPDHKGVTKLRAADGSPIVFGFTRLAILDLSPQGHQPMTTEDGAYTIVYNGEVYNFRSLKGELQSLGHRFRSNSDTEVVLRGYRQWGKDVVARLRGMFAFAIWDAKQQELVLCRDRLGVKPLYTYYDGRRLLFGSEVRTLLASGLVKRRLCPKALHGYLALGSVPQPRTILADVECLLPGHMLRVSLGQEGNRGRLAPPSVTRYFELPVPRISMQKRPRIDVVEEVSSVLHEAVALRLIADVPIGVLLSSGIDSTCVAVLARRAAASLSTFTMTYGDGQAESEEKEAREVASHLGTRHVSRVETASSILGEIPAFLSAIDQPSVDGLNTFLIAKSVRQAGLKVALSGLGGDEVFCGYRLPRVYAALRRLGTSFAPPKRLQEMQGAGEILGQVARLLRSPWLSPLPLYVQKSAMILGAFLQQDVKQARALYGVLRGLFPGPQLAALFHGDLGLSSLDPADHIRYDVPSSDAPLSALDVVSYLDISNYLSNTLLRDADVMSMVHGVELRVPLCDHVLVSKVLSLGASLRMSPGRKKPLLVDASHSDLTEQAARRSKRGFVLPLENFLSSDLSRQVAEVLLDAGTVSSVGLSDKAVASLWQRYRAGRARTATWRIWSLFLLLSWVQKQSVRL